MKDKCVRWSILFKEYVKRDYKMILIWVLGLGIFSGGFVPAFVEIGKGDGLAGLYETMKNPAMVAIAGPLPVDKAEDYTLGAVYGHEMLLFCALFAMVITAIHVVSHTRKEEEQGLSELVRSYRVGRFANSFAVMVEMIGINIVLGIFTGALVSAFRVETMDVGGSFLFGASVASAGIIGGAISLVFAQIMPTSSGANGASITVIGILFILRGMTDVSDITFSKINPLGWTYLTAPFTHNRWWYLIFAIVFTIVLIIVAFALEEKRDMGSGYIPHKTGKEHAGILLQGPVGLTIHLNKGAILGWIAGFVAIGASYGSIYGDMQTFLESNDMIKQMFTLQNVSVEASFTSTIMMVMIGIVTILPIVVVSKLFTEESNGRLAQLYSTKVGRPRMYIITILVATVVGALGLLVSAVSIGGAAIAAMGDDSTLEMKDFIESAFNGYAELLLFIGISAALLGWLPQALKATYAYLGYSFGLSYFGKILNFPEWFEKTSALNWSAKLPVEEFDTTSFVFVLVVSAVLIGLGYVGYCKRDLRGT